MIFIDSIPFAPARDLSKTRLKQIELNTTRKIIVPIKGIKTFLFLLIPEMASRE